MEKNKKVDDDYFARFPRQLRNMNIIPSYDKPGPKQVGYKWKNYEDRPYPPQELLKHQGNYALITGDPFQEDCYLIVIDIDNPVFCRYFKGEGTFTVKTPGGGYHLFYKSKTPLGNKNFLYRLPIDIRGVGGYLIIPPSSYDGKKYVVVSDVPIKKVNNISELIENKIPPNLRGLYTEYRKGEILKFKDRLHKERNISLFEIIYGTYGREREWYPLDPRKEKGDIIRIKNPIRYEADTHSFLIFNAFNKWYDLEKDEGGDVLDYMPKILDEDMEAISYLASKYSVPKPVVEKTLDDFFTS